ncbi:MFS general substrate transporter [Neolentinus lepideus HHB14362 ss-1]|uniref:MFS general substrate transporter n=1 Tax=Neolentinus lepideus HHB14362 ss-1 TaxID=1314782 RepID=A0A165SNK2_9AGAM|nr:MFS general substrate transporter [Neolentinus lepideus HHB14362 ss-1]
MQPSTPPEVMLMNRSSTDEGLQGRSSSQDQGVRVVIPSPFGVTLHATVTQTPTTVDGDLESARGTLNDKESIPEKLDPSSPVPPKDPTSASLEPPDGGLQAWLTVLGAVLVSLSTFGVVNAYGAFSDFYKTKYLSNYSATLVSMIGAVQVFVLYGLGSISGPLFDAYGPKYMIPISGAIASFALFMLSITKPEQIWQQFLTQSVLFNIGAAFGFFPALGVVAHWFKRKAAYALGCVIAGASAGGIIFPIMLHKLVPRIGFGWSVRAIAFIVLGCYSIASVTIKSRRPPKPLPPLTRIIDFRAFTDIRFALMAIGLWFNILSAFNPFFYVGLYGIVTAGESAVTPYLLAILCSTSIAGRVLPGIVADRVGRFNTITVATLVSGILSLAMWYTADSQAVVIAFAALYGFVSGPCFSLMPACVTQISPIEKVGARIGMLFGFLSTGALAGTPIGGVFIKVETRANFQHLILYTGVLGITGSVFLLAAKLKCNPRLFAVV